LLLWEDEKQALLEGLKRLSDIFWGPDLLKCEKMISPSSWCPFERLIPRLNASSAQALELIKKMMNTFSGGETLCANLEEAYVRLFISNRKGIPAPLYASCYEEVLNETAPLMGEPAVEMRERFSSKGLSLAGDVAEPPDHLSIELEYLYFLLEKGWTEKDNQPLEEAARFSSETMLPWVQKFRQRLGAVENENPFYPLIASILCGILQLVGRL
jgi:putative dimethyl sulfoxide reductase chaperone